jgi:hypothetical protein
MEDQVPEVPLVLVSNPYLEKKAAIIRQKPILWEVRWKFNTLSTRTTDKILRQLVYF